MTAAPPAPGSTGFRDLAGLHPLAWVALIVLFVLRLPHLGGPLDDRGSWRQADAASTSAAFARHGADLLHPRVCWDGAHGVWAAGLPLPSAIAAPGESVFGVSPAWDRVVSLLFCALAAFWFHRLVRAVADGAVAQLALVVYLAAPLSMFFSRAAGTDFAAQAFTLGLLHHALVSARGGGLRHAAAAAACGALAAMMQGVAVLPVLAPLVLVMLTGASLAAVAWPALALLASAGAYLLWRLHAQAVDAGASELLWGPAGSHPGAMRIEWANVVVILPRLVLEITTSLGVLFVLAMPFWRARGAADHAPSGAGSGAVRRPDARLFVAAWLLGCVARASLRFTLGAGPGTDAALPFVAPLAFAIALGAAALLREERRAGVRVLATLGFAGVLVMSCMAPGALQYYRIDELRDGAGAVLRQQVPAGELLVVVDRDSRAGDPRLLYRADREGWALRAEDVDLAALQRLERQGARWLAYVSEPGIARLAPPPWLRPREVATQAVAPAEGGSQPLAIVHVFRIADAGTVAR